MSDLIIKETHCSEHAEQTSALIKQVLEPEEKDLGGFSVRRILPTRECRSIGPFVFFDHLGPADFPPGQGIDVRPHPHIGLATITYVFEGEILHRDSLGEVQPIRPEEINWMTAGRGISHSERTPPVLRQQGHTLEALQLWVALPEDQQEAEPFFMHYDSNVLPLIERGETSLRVLVGEAYGVQSPVKTHSPTLYVAARLATGEKISVPDSVEECAVYILSGKVRAQNSELTAHSLALFEQGSAIELMAEESSRLVFIGGTPLGKRTVWWNLVSSDKKLIEKAKCDWKNGTFPQVPGEIEFIPLPE